MTNQPDMIISTKNRKDAYDGSDKRSCHKCHAKGNTKDTKIREIIWDRKCVIISVMTGATERATEVLKKNFGSHTRKTFNRFATNGSYTWNLSYCKESTAVWNLKSELWAQRRIITKKRLVARDDEIIINLLISPSRNGDTISSSWENSFYIL